MTIRISQTYCKWPVGGGHAWVLRCSECQAHGPEAESLMQARRKAEMKGWRNAMSDAPLCPRCALKRDLMENQP